MAKPLLEDASGEVIKPVLPSDKPVGRKTGRPWVPNRAAVSAILFVLKTGSAWEDVPKECGWGSGITAWRRLRSGQRRGRWRCGRNPCALWKKARDLARTRGQSWSRPRPLRVWSRPCWSERGWRTIIAAQNRVTA
ncbi:MAG: transposase [Candidatus Omnitrophica bacterium]|nr:transposase [Candidatus Omnitrophota bacterium]